MHNTQQQELLKQHGGQRNFEEALAFMRDQGKPCTPQLSLDLRLHWINQLVDLQYAVNAPAPAESKNAPGFTPRHFSITPLGREFLGYAESGVLWNPNEWTDIMPAIHYAYTSEAADVVGYLLQWVAAGREIPDRGVEMLRATNNSYVDMILNTQNGDWSFTPPVIKAEKTENYVGGVLTVPGEAALKKLEAYFVDKNLSSTRRTPSGAAFSIVEAALLYTAATYPPLKE